MFLHCLGLCMIPVGLPEACLQTTQQRTCSGKKRVRIAYADLEKCAGDNGGPIESHVGPPLEARGLPVYVKAPVFTGPGCHEVKGCNTVHGMLHCVRVFLFT